MFSSLTERQKQILGLVVRSYIEDGHPVGSTTLVRRYGLDVSSATVRNELAFLTELGYIVQPHTSGGRIPTEIGYRYFVQRLVGDFELPIYEQQMIRHQFHQLHLELDQWMRLATAILSRTSLGASFITSPRARSSRFKHLQLISTRGRLVLMILVLSGGTVKQQMLTLATPLLQQQLSHGAERLNRLFEGRSPDEIEAMYSQLDEFEQDVTRLAVDILRQTDGMGIHDIYHDGLSNLLKDEGTRQAVRLLEERSIVSDIVQDFTDPDRSGVQVVIGGEGRWEQLKSCSIILGQYGIGDQLMGEIAVIGSMRMPYSRNISAVRYIADIMSGFIMEYYSEEVKPSVISEAGKG